jgi:hypothetical protein
MTVHCTGAQAGTPVAGRDLVLRRMLALAGFVMVVSLALLLLYGVYVHHSRTTPYVEDDRSIVAADVKFASVVC